MRNVFVRVTGVIMLWLTHLAGSSTRLLSLIEILNVFEATLGGGKVGHGRCTDVSEIPT